MTEYKYAKRKLMKAGYKIKASTGNGCVWLKKDEDNIILWIEEDSYGYLFIHHGLNISVHKKGFSFWATNHNHDYVDPLLGDYFDTPEHVLATGRHIGHHVKTVDEIANRFFN